MNRELFIDRIYEMEIYSSVKVKFSRKLHRE